MRIKLTEKKYEILRQGAVEICSYTDWLVNGRYVSKIMIKVFLIDVDCKRT